MSSIAGEPAWRLANSAGRLLLLGVVAFWWGAYVAPQLFSLAFPALLSPSNPILGRLNASNEGTIANTVSAATLAGVTLIAIAAAVVSRRRAAGWIAVGGWAAIATTTAALTFEELAEFKKWGPISVVRHSERLGLPWPVLISPLVVAFVLAIAVFIHRGLRGQPARFPLTLGIACWLFALVHEAIDPFLFAGRARGIEYVLEETLEICGTLLIGLSAAGALRAGRPPLDRLAPGRWRRPLLASLAVVVVLGAVSVVFLFRAPLVEALAPYTRAGAFGVSLQRQEALVQELRMPGAPVQSVRLRLSNCDLTGTTGTVSLRVGATGTPESSHSQGSVAVPVGDCPRWRDIELLPPLTAPAGRPLVLQVVADINPGSELRVGATKGNRYADGRLWINGALAWPDQNLEFVAYGAPEPTRSKLLALGRLFTSDWRWPLLVADVVVALTLITFVPVLLSATALRRTSEPRLSPAGSASRSQGNG